MAKIIPAILAKDLDDLQSKYFLISDKASEIQIDVSDGRFTSALTWREPDDLVAAEWLALPFELHLMIAEPERTITDWLSTGAERVVIHLESTRQLASILGMAKPIGTEVVVSLNIETPVSALSKWFGKIGAVQLMGIARLGHQGEMLDERVFDKIKELKTLAPEIVVAVDGGVNEHTIALLHKAGADRLVVGSALFGSENVLENFNKLEKLLGN